jgi:hypothetical protein
MRMSIRQLNASLERFNVKYETQLPDAFPLPSEQSREGAQPLRCSPSRVTYWLKDQVISWFIAAAMLAFIWLAWTIAAIASVELPV